MGLPEMQGYLQLQCVQVSLLTSLFHVCMVCSRVNLNRAPFRKQKGHEPTGQLSNKAKATGFSSVTEMLLKSAERLNHENGGSGMSVSLENVGTLTKFHYASCLTMCTSVLKCFLFWKLTGSCTFLSKEGERKLF